jgi:hypothetical protein
VGGEESWILSYLYWHLISLSCLFLLFSRVVTLSKSVMG